MTEPGFADPVHDAQGCFRILLEAMSHPGRICEIATPRAAPGLGPAAAAVALTLCDLETPVWLAAEAEAAAPWLRFHCGAPIVADPAQAAFAFLRTPDSLPPFDAFPLGSDAYPDRSTTVVIELAGLSAGRGVRLAGPGIDGTALIALDGLGEGFWRERNWLAGLFPRGLDFIFTAGHRLVALPRTTRLEG